jgi:hypothetical protein
MIMNDFNTKFLLEKYPKLYAQYFWDKTQTCMCWGFDVDDGWFKLVDNVSKKITKLDPKGKIQCVQCKEKFGGLRFYYEGQVKNNIIADKIRKIVSDAEYKSFHICEMCGKKGKLREDLPWMKTFCIKHYRDRLKKIAVPRNKTLQ